MEINLQFKQNTGVFAADGEAVGHIDRVVVDPHSNVVTHIVVQKGFLFKEDKVVPIDFVAEATEDRITLRENAGDLHALPSFEEKHYLTVDSTPREEPVVTPAPLGYSPLAATGEEPPPGPRLIAQTEHNIPAGTIALKEGAKIITAEGKEVGHLERVFTDTTAHRATHLVIAQGLLAPKRRLIPITWANIVDEDEVHLAVKESTLDWLRTYPN